MTDFDFNKFNSPDWGKLEKYFGFNEKTLPPFWTVEKMYDNYWSKPESLHKLEETLKREKMLEHSSTIFFATTYILSGFNEVKRLELVYEGFKNELVGLPFFDKLIKAIEENNNGINLNSTIFESICFKLNKVTKEKYSLPESLWFKGDKVLTDIEKSIYRGYKKNEEYEANYQIDDLTPELTELNNKTTPRLKSNINKAIPFLKKESKNLLELLRNIHPNNPFEVKVPTVLLNLIIDLYVVSGIFDGQGLSNISKEDKVKHTSNWIRQL